MKLKKPRNATPAILTAVGVLGGAVVGRAIQAQLPTYTETTTGTMYHGGLALAGGTLAVFTDGNDSVASLVRGMGYGMFADQAITAVGINVKGQTENQTVKAMFGLNAPGLGCGCQGIQQPQLGQGRVIPLRDEYNDPQIEMYETEEGSFVSRTAL